jgi:hypothetical protein
MFHRALAALGTWRRSGTARLPAATADPAALRRRGAARLRGIRIPVPFDVEAFTHELAAHRGRAIVLRPWSNPVGLMGFWVPDPAADLIVYEQETSPMHREHIILHELSHLLCGHQPPVLTDRELAASLPRLGISTIRRAMRRAAYSSVEDREAEVLASLILERARKVGCTPPVSSDRRQHGAVGRLARIMEEADESAG